VNVRTKLGGAFAVYIALLAGLSLYHIRTTRRVVSSGHAFSDIASRLRTTSTIQLTRIAQVSSDAEKYVLTRDSGYLVKFQRTQHDYESGLRALDSASLRTNERSEFIPLLALWDSAKALSDSLALTRDTVLLRTFQQSLDRVHARTERLGAASQNAMAEELAAARQTEREAEDVTKLAAGGALLLTLLLSAWIARTILDPLNRLAEGTREVSAGRFTHRISSTGNDELAQVSREFNVMIERLDAVDKMKREFVSKVSHDLKTPLSSMQETQGVLLDEVAGPLTPKQRQLLEITQESAQRLSAMLNKLLDLSRIEAGIEPERQTVDVRPLLRRSVERLGDVRGDAAPQVSLVMNDAAQRFLVRGDADGLTQVFDNLLENALKFSPPGGQVRARLTDLATRGELPVEHWNALRRRGLTPGAVLVTVADEGPGVPDEEKEKVFARFYQTEAGRAVRSRGVGLGLAICREIVSDHGGVIWIGDNEPRGSVFHVLLPGAVKVGGDAATPELATDGAERA
jgi:signal transduction histidine kinase